MRLINISPLHYLINCGLPRANIGNVRDFISLNEQLKKNEQQLNFLSKCKSLRIFPTFILDNIQLSNPTLYPLGPPQQSSYLIRQLRVFSLNQHIKNKYFIIRDLKVNIICCKDIMYNSIRNQCLFYEILNVVSINNDDVKYFIKSGLQRKLDWLLKKHYSRPPSVIPEPRIILDDPKDRVTVVDVDENRPVQLSPEEISLLALGPNFAVAPKVDDKLEEQVKLNVAHFAYRCRWDTAISQQATDTDTPRQPSAVSQLRDKGCKFQRPFIRAPPTDNLTVEAELRLLSQSIINVMKDSTVQPNLTRDQQRGLRTLSARQDELHLSVSDKCGEFVVSSSHVHTTLTENHITSSVGVYKHVVPSRNYQGEQRPIVNVSDISYRAQLNNKCEDLENKCNKLIEDICKKNELDSKFEDILKVHNTTLPTMYTLVKTHKTDMNNPDLEVGDLKVRPIVSCSGSPTEKLAWLVAQILSPLLNEVPSHLRDIHSHLDILSRLPVEELKGLDFYTADVVSLYTNLSIEYCIDSLIEFASEHWDKLDSLGLTLVDLHKILDLVLSNSFFTYDFKLYIQLIGLFMGCAPSPLCAIIRVYFFERASVYTDIHFISPPTALSLFYGRYVDDMGSLAPDRDFALSVVNSIAEQDPDHRIKWELEYPEPGQFTPFLDTELRIDDEGVFHSRYYRKPAKKKITLHHNSHHPLNIKEQVVTNFYDTANKVSSDVQERDHSQNIVTDLLRQNGYKNPTDFIKRKSKKKKKKIRNNAPILELPYISEACSNKIRNIFTRYKIEGRIIFKPGRKLRNYFCNSRPRDSWKCTLANPRRCSICPNVSGGGCAVRNVVYKVTCRLCGQDSPQIYIGETYRPVHDRFLEHTRAAGRPDSYSDNAVGKHYKQHHTDCAADLAFEILDRQRSTVKRKISEARRIVQEEPQMNDRTELVYLTKFLIL